MSDPYLFASLEKHPLTEKQYQACVSSAQHTLVLAGAGTGKTSVIMGRLAYLWESQLAAPEQVLLLAFAVDAAKEIQTRAEKFLKKYPQLGSKNFQAKTFHSLGLSILTIVQGHRPALSQLVSEQALEAFIKEWVLSSSTEYRQLVHYYFTCCETALKTMAMFAYHQQDYQQYLGKTIFRSLGDDYVDNPVGLMIANVLYQCGIAYCYRAHFKQDIYLEQRYYPYRVSFFIKKYRVYIDVFDIEKNQLDAAEHDSPHHYLKKYRDQVRSIHLRHGTDHIEVYQDTWVENIYMSQHKKTNRCSEYCTPPMINTQQHDWCWQWWLSWQDYCREVFAEEESCGGHNGNSECRHSPLLRSMGRIEPLLMTIKNLLFHIKSMPLATRKDIVSQNIALAKRGEKIPMIGENDIKKSILYQLSIPVLNAYQTFLKQEKAIDFDDMIVQATHYIQEGLFTVPWTDILIDEFQDISHARFSLIEAMIQQQPNIRLFCVGDDWQTIYQFAGSELRYIKNFKAYMGECNIITLDKTFRFNSELCRVSGKFIQKNPDQYQKNIQAFTTGNDSAVTVVTEQEGSHTFHNEGTDNQALETADTSTLRAIFEDIQEKMQSFDTCSETCLILARFKHILPSSEVVQYYQRRYPMLAIRLSTIHASKGQEADYVMVLGVNSGEYGLPSEKENQLRDIKNDEEAFPYAQERRVFYVAMTRAKKHVYIVGNQQTPSVFIQEILAEKVK